MKTGPRDEGDEDERPLWWRHFWLAVMLCVDVLIVGVILTGSVFWSFTTTAAYGVSAAAGRHHHGLVVARPSGAEDAGPGQAAGT